MNYGNYNQTKPEIRFFLVHLFETSEWAKTPDSIATMCRDSDEAVVIGIIALKDNCGIIQSGHAGILKYESDSQCRFEEAIDTNIYQILSYNDIECSIRIKMYPKKN